MIGNCFCQLILYICTQVADDVTKNCDLIIQERKSYHTFKMEEYKVKQIFPGEIIGKQTFTFKLEGKATIFDLKEAFTNEEGYTPEQLRMVYRTADMDVPLDDTDKLEDIEDHTGQFLVECPTMGIFDGKLSLNVQDVKDVGEIAVLIGNKKCYEHFLMTRLVQDLTLPKGKFT